MEVVVIEGPCLGFLNGKLVIRKFDGKGWQWFVDGDC
jgi:hypothetical protein